MTLEETMMSQELANVDLNKVRQLNALLFYIPSNNSNLLTTSLSFYNVKDKQTQG